MQGMLASGCSCQRFQENNRKKKPMRWIMVRSVGKQQQLHALLFTPESTHTTFLKIMLSSLCLSSPALSSDQKH
jgi:hypothetical protein